MHERAGRQAFQLLLHQASLPPSFALRIALVAPPCATKTMQGQGPTSGKEHREARLDRRRVVMQQLAGGPRGQDAVDAAVPRLNYHTAPCQRVPARQAALCSQRGIH